MTIVADMAACILAELGELVTYQCGESAPVVLTALVTRHDAGFAPTGWSVDLFRNQARHAEIRFNPADVAAQPTDADVITIDGLAYEVRDVQRLPKVGANPLWWVCLCACDQRVGRP